MRDDLFEDIHSSASAREILRSARVDLRQRCLPGATKITSKRFLPTHTNIRIQTHSERRQQQHIGTQTHRQREHSANTQRHSRRRHMHSINRIPSTQTARCMTHHNDLIHTWHNAFRQARISTRGSFARASRATRAHRQRMNLQQHQNTNSHNPLMSSTA